MTFVERMEFAKELAGHGPLMGKLSVNQVYAHYQDSGVGPRGKPAGAFNHPRGGIAGYLSGTLLRDRNEYLGELATFLETESTLDEKMGDVVQTLQRQVFELAPREYWILRSSATGEVYRSGFRVRFYPAAMPRMSQAELNAMRAAGQGDATHGGESQHLSGFRGGAVTSRAARHATIRRKRSK